MVQTHHSLPSLWWFSPALDPTHDGLENECADFQRYCSGPWFRKCLLPWHLYPSSDCSSHCCGISSLFFLIRVIFGLRSSHTFSMRLTVFAASGPLTCLKTCMCFESLRPEVLLPGWLCYMINQKNLSCQAV